MPMAASLSSKGIPARKATQPATPKLRDSCHGCAASKLKCSKEKPTCARCSKRGMVCEYIATKRAGRKHGSRSGDSIKVTHALPPTPPSWSNSTTGTDSLLPSPRDLVQPIIPTHNGPNDFADLLPNFLSSTEPGASSTAVTALSTELDDFLASPISFSLLEMPDSHLDPHSLNKFIEPHNTGQLLLADDALSTIDISELPSLSSSKPHTPPNTARSRSPTGGKSEFNDALQGLPTDGPCSCLIRALGILKQLFPNASPSCRQQQQQQPPVDQQAFPDHHPDGASPPTLQNILSENQQALDSLHDILQCPCAHDGYLLNLACLIILKVLAWYAAAARGTSSPGDIGKGKSHSHDPSSGFPPTAAAASYHPLLHHHHNLGEDQARLAAQLVLSELHRVQRVVNELGLRMREHRLSTTTAAGTATASYGPLDAGLGMGLESGLSSPSGCLVTGGLLSGAAAFGARPPAAAATSFPFSAALVEHMEADLRRRLRSLSAEIVEMLRRG